MLQPNGADDDVMLDDMTRKVVRVIKQARVGALRADEEANAGVLMADVTEAPLRTDRNDVRERAAPIILRHRLGE